MSQELPQESEDPTALHLPVQSAASTSIGGLMAVASENPQNFQSILSDALARILAAGLQQPVIPDPSADPQLSGWGRLTYKPSTSTHRDYASSEESDSGEDCPEDMKLSEDEGLLPDQPAFTGLFRPAVFKLLLHKAKVITKFGVVTTTSEGSLPTPTLHDPLFQVTKPDKDVIPCHQWPKAGGPNLGPRQLQVAWTRNFIVLFLNWKTC